MNRPSEDPAVTPPGCVLSRLSASGPHRSSLWRRLRPRDNAATLLRGARACLALLAAAALLALAAPAQAQTEVWTATLTPGDLNFSILGCSNGIDTARCSSTTVLSEDSFNYDSTDYTITKLFVHSGGNFEFEVDADITTATAALTLVVGSTSLVLADADTITTRGRIWHSSGVSMTAGTDIAVKLTAPVTNTPPTSAEQLVDADEDTDYTFTADDFGFADTDAGDSLASVKIVTLPASGTGTLTLSGTPIGSGDLPKTVPADDLDELKYSPPANLYGTDVASFTFKVNDGTVDSDNAYTMTIDVKGEDDSATGAPGITGTAQVGQTLTATVGTIADADGVPDPLFSAAATTVQWIQVDGVNESDISGATSETYTLAAADAGKTIKVKVSFEDKGGTAEGPLTSDAYPSSGTVTASANTTAPALLSVTVTSTPRKTSDTYGAREHIEFSMTFDAPVTVTGDPTFAFDLGGPSTATWYAGSGTTTLRFSHAVSGGSSGDQDTNGISWAMNAIELNGGTIAGTDNAVTAILTHAAQSNLAGHKVDGRTTAVTPATVTDVVVTSTPMLMASGSSTADTYGFGETIVITVTVSEAVEVEGDPVFRFSLTNPGSAANNPQATYDRTRSIATTIVFTYTVQAGDMDNNGIWIGTHSQTFSLDANDRIRTASQQIDIDRSHLEKGTQGGHKVDGSLGAPTVPPDPTAPTLVSATATTLTIEWTHPGDGGSPLIRDYVHYRVQGATDWTNWYVGETPVTRAVITNLEAETAYDVRVHSTNAIGSSQWAQSATAFSTRANTPATGAPTITGTATVGQELTADASPIVDNDGLTDVDFTYQWLRVDADGTSDPVDITDATDATYTLTDDDAGKKVKVKVSFTDDLDSTETRTSAAYPSSGTVTAAPGTNTAPTAANNTVTTGVGTAYAFTADDFGFADMDTGDTLASVTIVTVPTPGTLALDGTAVLADAVVTTAQIDGDMLTFTPVAGASGDPYTTFTFKVNDGTDDSASAYTMTIDVTAAPVTNTAPTADHNTVTTGAAYAFTAADFGFMDADAGATLASVKIVTVPAAGTLALAGTAVALNDVVTKAQIDAGDLTFTPVAGASGTGYATFTFKVNDGTDDSASAYTMTIDVTAAGTNTAPTADHNTVTTAEDTAYTFTAADFGFMDGDTLVSVKILAGPARGTLALDGVAITAYTVVTKVQIDGEDAHLHARARCARHPLCGLQLQGERRHGRQHRHLHDAHRRDGHPRPRLHGAQLRRPAQHLDRYGDGGNVQIWGVPP